MNVSASLADALVQWLDILTWTSRAAQGGVEVAFEVGLDEVWDDLRWDADHDRKVLGAQLEDWQVDEGRRSETRTTLAAEWKRIAPGRVSNGVPSLAAQQRIEAGLQWLSEQRARLTAVATESVHQEPPGVQADFAAMLDEMCLVSS